MTITIHLFARGRELVGADTVSLDLPTGATVATLRRELTARYSTLAGLLQRSVVAVNHDFAVDDRVLVPGDELAIIPPVSGG